MIKTLLLGIAAFISCNAFSQNFNNNWVFGDSAGLNFSTAIPMSFASNILSYEACASISDFSGNLLFYTNGEKVWDKNNNVMPNGDSLNIGGFNPGYPSSSTQGVTILPMPGAENIFYIFQLQSKSDPPNYGLEYSKVDMTMNDGFGDVVEKNIDVFTGYLNEKMQAVKHANGRDWWLTTMQLSTNDTTLCLATFLITADTIEGPFIQCFTELPDVGSTNVGATGQMKFSYQGNKLLFTRGIMFLVFDFDRCSGEFSNLMEIMHNDKGLYGCEFSKDARIVYFTEYANIEGGNRIIQYCISCGVPVEETKQIIYEGMELDHAIGQLQLGLDGKIYAPTYKYNYADHEQTYFNTRLSVINNPNTTGLSCNFDTLSIIINYGRCTYTLPNMPNYNLGPLVGSECDTLQIAVNNILSDETFLIYPNPASDNIYFKYSNNNLSPIDINNITISDATGRTVKVISKLEDNSIYVGDLQAGLYLVHISTTNNKSFLSKLIIEK
jgi:hypothetical protein